MRARLPMMIFSFIRIKRKVKRHRERYLKIWYTRGAVTSMGARSFNFNRSVHIYSYLLFVRCLSLSLYFMCYLKIHSCHNFPPIWKKTANTSALLSRSWFASKVLRKTHKEVAESRKKMKIQTLDMDLTKVK